MSGHNKGGESLTTARPGRKLMIGIIISGGFVTLLNQTVMGPALPSIMADFGITAATGQWLTSIFLLVNGLMVPITAYLIGRFSTRQLFLTSMLIFAAGTVVCAVSGSYMILLAGRVLQAIGAGIQMPFVSVMLMLIFPKKRRGFALGMAGIVMGLAPALGPTVGGWLVDEWGWQAIFYLVAPIAALDILFGLFFLKNIENKLNRRLEWLSVPLSVIGFGGLLFGFSSAGSFGWGHVLTYAPIAAGALALFFFIRRQYKKTEPLLDLRVLRNRVFTDATILTMVAASAMTVGAVITPIYLQNVLGLSALQSGMVLMPGALLLAGLSPVSGVLFDRIGPRYLAIFGLSGLMIGTGMMAFIGAATPVLYIVVAYTLRMVSVTFINMPINTWGINALPNSKIADGNAINNTGRQVSGSIGTAVLVTVLTTVQSAFASSGSLAIAYGVDAAFGCAALIALVALVYAIIRVKPDKEEEE